MCHARWILLGVLSLALGGCGGSSDSGEKPAPDQGQASAAVTPGKGSPPAGMPSRTASPSEAVTQFLDAVRRGDDDVAAAMFTVSARGKAAEMGIQVAPRGSDTARYQVGQVEFVSEDVARVHSSWTDLDQDGKLKTDAMAWVLRREPEGWRVAGMIATVFEGEPPLLLDFENPQEALQKLASLRDEVERREATEAVQAQQPANSAEPIRR